MNQEFPNDTSHPAHFRLKTGLRFGIITSLINSLVSIALYSMGLIDFSGTSGGWISIVLLGLGIYLATEYYKKYSGGFMSGSDIVVTSLWLGFFSGLISLAFLLIQLQLDPSILEKMKNVVEMQMENQNMRPEDLEKAMEISEMFLHPGFLAVSALVSSLLSGLFAGFILSFFLKKSSDNPF